MQQMPCSANFMELQNRAGMPCAAAVGVRCTSTVKCVAAPSLSFNHSFLSLSHSVARLGLSRSAVCSLSVSAKTRRRFVATKSEEAEEDGEEEDEGEKTIEDGVFQDDDDSDEEINDDEEFSGADLFPDDSDSEGGPTANPQEGEIQSSKSTPPRGSWKSIFPVLSQKERKELRGHAHRLGKDIVLQHIGKAGVTPNTITCLSDALEKNELMKVKVLNNCPEEMKQIVQELEDGLEAQVVGKIGHVLVVYRPSLRKAEKEEKKLEMARMMRKKRFTRQRRR